MAKKQSKEVPHPEKDERILYVFNYLLTWLSGLILFLTEGQSNKRMKFHALQAIFLGIVTFIVAWIPIIGWLTAFLLWLYGMYVGVAAYGGRDISMPVIGDYAEKYSK